MTRQNGYSIEFFVFQGFIDNYPIRFAGFGEFSSRVRLAVGLAVGLAVINLLRYCFVDQEYVSGTVSTPRSTGSINPGVRHRHPWWSGLSAVRFSAP